MRITARLFTVALLAIGLAAIPGCYASQMSESAAESGQNPEDTGDDSDGGEGLSEGDSLDEGNDDGGEDDE